jgi:hypothetical protein
MSMIRCPARHRSALARTAPVGSAAVVDVDVDVVVDVDVDVGAGAGAGAAPQATTATIKPSRRGRTGPRLVHRRRDEVNVCCHPERSEGVQHTLQSFLLSS